MKIVKRKAPVSPKSLEWCEKYAKEGGTIPPRLLIPNGAVDGVSESSCWWYPTGKIHSPLAGLGMRAHPLPHPPQSPKGSAPAPPQGAAKTNTCPYLWGRVASIARQVGAKYPPHTYGNPHHPLRGSPSHAGRTPRSVSICPCIWANAKKILRQRLSTFGRMQNFPLQRGRLYLIPLPANGEAPVGRALAGTQGEGQAARGRMTREYRGRACAEIQKFA